MNNAPPAPGQLTENRNECKVKLAVSARTCYASHMSDLKAVKNRVVKLAGGGTKVGVIVGEFRGLKDDAGHPVYLSRSAVSQWHCVPPDCVLLFEKLTGVSRYEQRPDIFGDAPQGALTSSDHHAAA